MVRTLRCAADRAVGEKRHFSDRRPTLVAGDAGASVTPQTRDLDIQASGGISDATQRPPARHANIAVPTWR